MGKKILTKLVPMFLLICICSCSLTYNPELKTNYSSSFELNMENLVVWLEDETGNCVECTITVVDSSEKEIAGVMDSSNQWMSIEVLEGTYKVTAKASVAGLYTLKKL